MQKSQLFLVCITRVVALLSTAWAVEDVAWNATNCLTLLGKVDYLSEMTAAQKDATCDAMVGKRYNSGDFIIRQKDKSDGAYLIESGEILTLRSEKKKVLAQLWTNGAGDFIGKMGLLYKKRRFGSAVVSSDSATVGFISEVDFHKIMGPQRRKLKQKVDGKWKPRSKEVFGVDNDLVKEADDASAAAADLDPAKCSSLLAKVDFLSNVSDSEKKTLCDAMSLVTFNKGDAVIKQKEKADGLYFIETGDLLTVRTEKKKAEAEISHSGPGDVIGEFELINKKRRIASTIVNSDEARLLFLPADPFKKVLKAYLAPMKKKTDDRWVKKVKQVFGEETELVKEVEDPVVV